MSMSLSCDAALERMLEADVAELRGDQGGELARHLAACPRCGAVARTLVAELERVDEGLAVWARAGDVDAALAGLEHGASRSGQRVAGSGQRAARDRRGRWGRRYGWIPAAAAAVLAGVLLFPGQEPDWGAAPPAPEIDPVVAVRPPPDRSAAIMRTGNPNITIVWLYQEEET